MIHLPKKNPVYEKELWSANRSAFFALAIMAYHAIMAVIALAVFSNMLSVIREQGQGNYSLMLQMYLILAMVECMLVICIIPGIAGSGIAKERERHALELMQISGISAWKIVLGKLKSYMNTAIVLILSGSPALALVYVYGGIQISDFIAGATILALIAGYLCNICLFCSAISRKPGHAIVISYGAVLFLIGGTLLIHYAQFLLVGQTYGESIGSPIAWYHYLLLLNPLVTFFEVMNQQAGSKAFIFDMINYQGNYRPNWVTENWITISLMLQLAVGALLLIATVYEVKRKR
ncbi:MAG: ABC transporter permease [Lachnospiraceae bacterium]|nr:ABC transporter permease [Lachnospiraceae bacterium]